MPRILDLSTFHKPKGPVVYTDSNEENVAYLERRYPDKILFELKDVAEVLCISYEFARLLVNNNSIASKNIGKRKLVHRGELARLITEGVDNNVSKKN